MPLYLFYFLIKSVALGKVEANASAVMMCILRPCVEPLLRSRAGNVGTGAHGKKRKPEHLSPNPDARFAQLDANRAKVSGMAA